MIINHIVESSKKGAYYQVGYNSNSGALTCNCIGYKYRHDCRHTKTIRPQLDINKPVRYSRNAVEKHLDWVNAFFGHLKYDIVGSYRRGLSTLKDIDILVTCSVEEFQTLYRNLEECIDVEMVLAGDSIIRGNLKTFNNILVDIYRTDEEHYWSQLLMRTGSKENNIKMRGKAKSMGFLLNEYGFFDATTKQQKHRISSEKDAYEFLGLTYLPPERR